MFLVLLPPSCDPYPAGPAPLPAVARAGPGRTGRIGSFSACFRPFAEQRAAERAPPAGRHDVVFFSPVRRRIAAGVQRPACTRHNRNFSRVQRRLRQCCRTLQISHCARGRTQVDQTPPKDRRTLDIPRRSTRRMMHRLISTSTCFAGSPRWPSCLARRPHLPRTPPCPTANRCLQAFRDGNFKEAYDGLRRLRRFARRGHRDDRRGPVDGGAMLAATQSRRRGRRALGANSPPPTPKAGRRSRPSPANTARSNTTAT